MVITENTLNALAALEYRGIGRAWINAHIRGGESVERMVTILHEKIVDVTVCDFERKRIQIQSEIEQLGDAIDGVVGIGDENFPTIRSTIKKGERPVALFYRGDIRLIKSVDKNVAVIGMLEPSKQIENDERKVVRELVNFDMCIVSGLAHGCDAVGHRECLTCGGRTVAFLSSPLTQINPPSNFSLAEEIVAKGGLLVTEYFRPAYSKREFIGRYAERDRLQALFSGAIVLAASYAQRDHGKDSGSRFAMIKAKEYGIPRYVIYDPIRDKDNPMYNLSRDEMAIGAKELSLTSIHITTIENNQQLALFTDHKM
jgi:DNA processing protein